MTSAISEGMRIVALEEHVVTPEVLDPWAALDPQWQDAAPSSASEEVQRRLLDTGELRLAAMDAAGVDVQVLSLTTPGLQSLAPADAVALQVAVNDRLAAAVATHPDRLQAFATLATPDPPRAAEELRRAVSQLGLNGAMLLGRTRDRTLDDPAFWPIYEAAAELRAPLYIHPQTPPAQVRAGYYNGFADPVSGGFATFGLGWHYETGIQLLRMILAGVFDRFGDLQVILGHWGEVVLFYLERTTHLMRMAGLPRSLPEYVRDHVLITPGGILSERYLRWTLEVVGADRIMFAGDYPYAPIPDGGAVRFLRDAALSDADREAIAEGNWARVCAAIRR